MNERLANDGLSDKPKEDRIVKFKDEPDRPENKAERGRSKSRNNRIMMGKNDNNNKNAPATVSILKDSRNKSSQRNNSNYAAIKSNDNAVSISATNVVVTAANDNVDTKPPVIKMNSSSSDSSPTISAATQEESGYDSDQTPRGSDCSSNQDLDPNSPESKRSLVVMSSPDKDYIDLDGDKEPSIG